MELISDIQLTFDDVLLVPAYSEVLPSEVDTSVRLFDGIELKVPILSSAMDSVTEWRMAYAMAICGGCGVIHKNLSLQDQARHVKTVKDAISYGTKDEITLDRNGRCVVGAALGPGKDLEERAEALTEAGTDFFVLDTAHGHSAGVLRALSYLTRRHPSIPVMAGNVATPEATGALIEGGAKAIKVGIGGGSICTTRIVSGVGIPQFSAIVRCAEVAERFGIPVIADGGIKHSGDITKAIGAGASCVMIGSLLAGALEAPGDTIDVDGAQHRVYRGMGSLSAMEKGSKDRYGQAGVSNGKLIPEGVEARVPYRGPVHKILFQLVGGLRSGMGYTGSKNIPHLRSWSRFVRITSAGLHESHVHGVQMQTQPPNYSRS